MLKKNPWTILYIQKTGSNSQSTTGYLELPNGEMVIRHTHTTNNKLTSESMVVASWQDFRKLEEEGE